MSTESIGPDPVAGIAVGECVCGYGPGMTCHPSCPSYTPPPPAEIRGKVSVGGKVRNREPDNASYHRFNVPGTTAGQRVTQLLGKDENRCRALVWVSGDTGSVLLGRRDSVGNAVGVEISAGMGPLELKNQDDVYAWNEGADPVTVNVVNERYYS